MKTFLSILLIIAASTHSLLAQTTTLTFPFKSYYEPDRQQDIPVLAGEVFELLTWAPGNGSAFLTVDGVFAPVNVANGSALPSLGFVIAGPRTVSVFARYDSSIVCTYKLTTLTPLATQNVASQAVVIPENAAAPVDVIYESSTDLINWTAAVAGSYAPSTSKRFFRVRIVLH